MSDNTGAGVPPAGQPHDPGAPQPGQSGQPGYQGYPNPYQPWGPHQPYGHGQHAAPPAGYWTVPPRRRGPARTWVHASWLAVAVLVAVFAGAGGYHLGGQHSVRSGTVHRKLRSGPSPAPQAIGPGQCAASAEASITGASTRDARLLRELLPMPRGAQRIATIGKPKAYTLRAFLRKLYPADKGIEQGFLSARCFQTAVNSEWRQSQGVQVSVWLLQFAGRSGAQSYTLGQAQTDISLQGGHGRYATVSGVPDGRIVQTSRLDKYGNTFTRMFGYVGNVAILIHVFRPAYLPAEASVEPLLRAQARRLQAR
jgi:hypothetical protein